MIKSCSVFFLLFYVFLKESIKKTFILKKTAGHNGCQLLDLTVSYKTNTSWAESESILTYSESLIWFMYCHHYMMHKQGAGYPDLLPGDCSHGDRQKSGSVWPRWYLQTQACWDNANILTWMETDASSELLNVAADLVLIKQSGSFFFFVCYSLSVTRVWVMVVFYLNL